MVIIIWFMMVNIYMVGGAITILKHMSQLEGLSHILWQIKHV